MERFDIEITSDKGWFNLHLKEIWKYRDLILLLVRRDFVTEYKQTVLGPAWSIIRPLITTILFTVIFGRLAGLAPKGTSSFIFFMSGTVVWGYFVNCMNKVGRTFTANSHIFGKVYFPRMVIPFATIFSNLISFMIQFGLLLLFYLYFLWKGTVYPSWYMLLVPMLIAHTAILGLGCGVIMTSLTTKYRDLVFVLDFGLQVWMYITPIAYDVSIIPQKYMKFYFLNPMTPVINAFRCAFLGVGTFSWTYYLISWAVTIFFLLIGIMLFSRVEKDFIDTI